MVTILVDKGADIYEFLYKPKDVDFLWKSNVGLRSMKKYQPSIAGKGGSFLRLEMAARQHRLAVGIASALPVSIAHIAKWAKSAASRGVLLVPVTAAAGKDKQT